MSPKNKNHANRKWSDPVGEFAGHLSAGLLIFAMMTSAAVGIWWAITWLKSYNVDPVIIWALQMVEYVLLAFDVILFLVWVVTSATSAYNSMKEQLKR